ncbi:hypothetical protein DENSPDRAFT_769110 [Dentipellis sp. KUC8613]|nr:hypothetical protein DENSPDRAFT_769110 [Dentipellis sp. KUC8613]
MDASLILPTPTHQPGAVQHFVGFVETTTDALRLIMAARQGVIPRITRRLNDSERRAMIRSGAVFVFCVEESGIKRWTEGLSWSPSRIIGNFLVYREVTERGNSRGFDRRTSAVGTSPLQGPSLGPSSAQPLTFFDDQTITVKVAGTDHHLISYYRDEDVRSGRLQRPTQQPTIMALSIPPEMVRATNFRHPPHIEIGPDGSAHMYGNASTRVPSVTILMCGYVPDMMRRKQITKGANPPALRPSPHPRHRRPAPLRSPFPWAISRNLRCTHRSARRPRWLCTTATTTPSTATMAHRHACQHLRIRIPAGQHPSRH